MLVTSDAHDQGYTVEGRSRRRWNVLLRALARSLLWTGARRDGHSGREPLERGAADRQEET